MNNHYAESALKAAALAMISENDLDPIHPKLLTGCKGNKMWRNMLNLQGQTDKHFDFFTSE